MAAMNRLDREWEERRLKTTTQGQNSETSPVWNPTNNHCPLWSQDCHHRRCQPVGKREDGIDYGHTDSHSRHTHHSITTTSLIYLHLLNPMVAAKLGNYVSVIHVQCHDKKQTLYRKVLTSFRFTIGVLQSRGLQERNRDL